MALISSINGSSRRIYLGVDSTSVDVQPMDIYKEMRTLRQTDENLRKYDVFLEASGYVPKGGGKFTARLVTCLSGTRIIPYGGSNHTLTIIGEIITDDGLSGIDCFDRTSLTNEVNIDYQPPQVEIIEITTGGGIGTPAEVADAVWDEATINHVISGTTGKALTDAAAAGNPWDTPIDANPTEGTYGWFMTKKLLTFAKWIGLR